MTRLADIELHIDNMETLDGIVGALRSLAGLHAREADHALAGVRRYGDLVASAIAGALPLIDDGAADAGGRSDGRKRALIAFAAEHGFVGGFNERLFEALAVARKPDDILFLVGSRGAALAAERKIAVDWTQPLATRVGGVAETARRLADALYRAIAAGKVGRVTLLYHRYRQGRDSRVAARDVLPLDASALKAPPAAQPPLHTLAPGALLEKLTAEYVFAELTEAVVESLASENAARFAAMNSAQDNIARKIDRLREDARRTRQEEITDELLDLMIGGLALAGGVPGGGPGR